MPTKIDNQIRMSDGRLIGYAEYGDPQGRPVLHFHGLPSSRLEGHHPAIDEIATRLHARIIVVERPGIGLSDYKPYTITSWPDIVAEFGDRLHLDRFAIMGLSSGGKYVAACAWKIPQRVTVAAIISGTCPFNLPGAKEAMSKKDRQTYGFADKAPWLFRLTLWKITRDVRKNPSSVLSLFTEISEQDKAALARTEVKHVFEEMVVEAFRQGSRGPALDWKLEARPWGFPLQDIRMPIHIWHGERDMLCPVEYGRILAKAIPGAQAKFYHDEGHVSLIVNRYEEVLRTVVF